MLKEKTFKYGNISLNYADSEGEGPPLLLLHGGSARWQHFIPLIPLLTQRWRVYALDLPGHGRSADRDPHDYRLSDMARQVGVFLDYLGEPAAIFGHSLGGFVGIWVAGNRPEQVRGLVIGDSPLDPDILRKNLLTTRPMWAEIAQLSATTEGPSELGRALYAW